MSSCASCRGLATLALGCWPLSAAYAAAPGSSSAAPVTRSTPTNRFMIIFRMPAKLLGELGDVDEADLLHVVALRRGQHLGHDIVLGAPVGPQVDLGLRLLVTLGVEVALQLIHARHRAAVPHHRAVEVDLEVDDLGRGRR